MAFDAWLEGLGPGEWTAAVLAGLAAFGYILILARAFDRARLLVALAKACRRRIEQEQQLEKSWGIAPRLEQFRSLEREIEDRLRREGVRFSP